MRAAGYNNDDFITNLGTMYVILNLNLIAVVLLPLINKIGVYSKWVKRLHKNLSDMLFWNGFIIIFLEGGVELIICSIMNIRDVLDGDN